MGIIELEYRYTEPIQKGGNMPRTEKKYPDWVQAYRSKGMTVKKKGNSFYLYKRTSRRVPGKKVSAAR